MAAKSHDELGLERLVFFSDAVFAIAITLLVLEIRLPHLSPEAGGRELIRALLPLTPKLIGFAVSFAVVGSMWIEHHRIFRYIGGWDDGLLWRNLLLLLLVAFMPFPTAVYSENHQMGAALVLYAGSIGLAGLAKVWLWRYAAKNGRLLSASATRDVVRSVGRRSWAVPLTCLITASLGACEVPVAYATFAFIPLVAWLLDRRQPRQRRNEAA